MVANDDHSNYDIDRNCTEREVPFRRANTTQYTMAPGQYLFLAMFGHRYSNNLSPKANECVLLSD